jgi:hypothetical protein
MLTSCLKYVKVEADSMLATTALAFSNAAFAAAGIIFRHQYHKTIFDSQEQNLIIAAQSIFKVLPRRKAE